MLVVVLPMRFGGSLCTSWVSTPRVRGFSYVGFWKTLLYAVDRIDDGMSRLHVIVDLSPLVGSVTISMVDSTSWVAMSGAAR